MLLVGDPAQLGAISIGGGFALLAERHGATRLEQVRRFVEPWERDAFMALRRRDRAALAEYAMRDRLHAGTARKLESQLFDAWRADALASTDGRRSVLMLVATNEQAAVLSERARNVLLAAGTVSDGPAVQLADNVASAGDHIVTRRNNRRLRTSNDGWVVNGDVWTIEAVHPMGAVDARRHADGATATLPAGYLADHAHLAYATTVYRAQGMTVDVCHAAVTAATSHAQLYVAATRGRHGNHLWVTVDADREIIRDAENWPDAEHVLARVLARRHPDRGSAYHTIVGELQEMQSLARLGAVFEDAARTATDQWLHEQLTEHGLGHAAEDKQWRSLVAQVRQAALAGYDVTALLDDAVHVRALEHVDSAAAVLHWRIGKLANATAPVRPPGFLASLPQTQGPTIEVARQAGELIRRRWRDLRAALSHTPGVAAGAEALGARPAGRQDASAWLTAATAVTAYRERYEIPDHLDMLDERPPASRPDGPRRVGPRPTTGGPLSRAAAPRPRRPQLAQLHTRMESIIVARPPSIPHSLRAPRQQLHAVERLSHTATGPAPSRSVRRLRGRLEALEYACIAYARWQQRANQATATRRHVELELRGRLASRLPVRRT